MLMSDREILFQGFSDSRMQTFLDLGVEERYPVRGLILKEGEGGSDMYMVDEGIISVWIRNVKVNEVRKDTVLGVSTLIEPHIRTASLIAETQARVHCFSRTKVLKFLETIPPRLFQQFFVNAFQIHMNLIGHCDERIVQLSRELNA